MHKSVRFAAHVKMRTTFMLQSRPVVADTDQLFIIPLIMLLVDQPSLMTGIPALDSLCLKDNWFIREPLNGLSLSSIYEICTWWYQSRI